MATPRVTSAVVQVVRQGAERATIRATTAVVQAVTTIIAYYVRLSDVTLQVIHQGDGAVIRVTDGTTQVIWTTGAADGTRQRAFTFDLDGHVFYALDMGPRGTLVYDLATQQWARFQTEGFDGNWNFKNGFQWRDGKKIVGGHDGTGQLLELSVGSYLDEGWRPVVYEVRGLLPVKGVDFIRQYSLQLVGSAGVLADSIAPVLHMRFSDDRGETWSPEYTVTLTTDTRQRIEFRSLGAFTAPGRIFRLYDEGGVKFIAFVEAEIGGENGRLPA